MWTNSCPAHSSCYDKNSLLWSVSINMDSYRAREPLKWRHVGVRVCVCTCILCTTILGVMVTSWLNPRLGSVTPTSKKSEVYPYPGRVPNRYQVAMAGHWVEALGRQAIKREQPAVLVLVNRIGKIIIHNYHLKIIRTQSSSAIFITITKQCLHPFIPLALYHFCSRFFQEELQHSKVGKHDKRH